MPANAPKSKRRGPSSTARLQKVLGKPSAKGTLGHLSLHPKTELEKRHARCMRQSSSKRPAAFRHRSQYTNMQKSAHYRDVRGNSFARRTCVTCNAEFESDYPWSKWKLLCPTCYISEKFGEKAEPYTRESAEAAAEAKAAAKKNKEGKWCPCDDPTCKKKVTKKPSVKSKLH